MTIIESVKCSCGGIPIEAETTDCEEKEFGCGRRGCCVKAYECPECKTRFTLGLAAPEA